MSANSNADIQSFDMSWGSLPPADYGSLDIEMFAPLTGVVTPSWVWINLSLVVGHPWLCSWRQPLQWQGCPRNRQKRYSFWPAKKHRSWGGGKLVHVTSSTYPTRRHCSAWAFRLLATRRLSVGALTVLQHTTQWYDLRGRVRRLKNLMKQLTSCAKRQAKHGWIQTLYSSVMLWSIRISWATSSQRAKMPLRHCMTASGQLLWRWWRMLANPLADGLGIAMRLVDMLPTILIHLAFHSSTPGLTRFVPEVYACLA